MWKIVDSYIHMVPLMIGVNAFGDIILNEKPKLDAKKRIMFFNTICILHAIVLSNFDGTLKTLFMLLNNVLFFKYTFDLNLSKSTFTSFFCTLLFTIPDIIVTLFLTKILNLSSYYYNEFAGSIISNIIVISIYIPLTYILKGFLRKIIYIKIDGSIKVIIYYVLTFICISIFFYRSFNNIKINIDFFVSLFLMLTFLLILISLIRQTIQNNKIKEEYDNLLEFMTTYENEIEKQRILRHETKNEFLAIRAKLCDNQKNKEIVGYIDEILKDKIKVKQEAYAKFGYLPANGIKGLCYFKTQEAEEKGIQVSLNISKRIKDSSIYKLSTKEQREFGRIIGVILDNAIEASEKSDKKQLGIEAYVNSEKEYKMIISNTYNNEIDNKKIGKEKFSTKGKNRGHGLLLVKHILSENKTFELYTNIQNDIYTQTIIIKKV